MLGNFLLRFTMPACIMPRRRYKQDYQAVTNPRFSPLDLATTANLPAGSPRFFAHAVAGWLVTLLALRLLWRFQQAALRLRLQHLTTAPRGTASHTVLLRDIPGIDFGEFCKRALLATNVHHRALCTQICLSMTSSFHHDAPAGTIAHRTDSTLLCFLPRGVILPLAAGDTPVAAASVYVLSSSYRHP